MSIQRFFSNRGWSLALFVSVTSSQFAYSDPAAAEEALELKKVEVTGTHIKRTDLEGSSPLVVIDQEYIKRSGAATVNELVRNVIYNAAGTLDEQQTQGFAPASSGIDLRGLGVNRTLVLIDGRRVPIFPFAQNGSESFVDLNLIPLAAIERVEILKDGASAIYGADAVAGVVNFILRKDYDGALVSAQYGQTSEGDGEETHLSFTAGATVEQSNLTFVLDYLDRNPIWARDRDISESANGPIDNRSPAGNPGTIFRPDGPQPDPRCPPDRINEPFCVFDFAPFATLVPETERLGVTALLDHEVSDTVRVFARAMYTQSESERDLAPAGSNPDPRTWFTVSGDDPNNPFPGEDVAVIYRFLELGPRVDEFKTDAYNILGGVAGNVGLWDWEVGAGAGTINTESRGVSGFATISDLQAAVDSGVLNLFGDSPDFDADQVAFIPSRKGESDNRFVDLKVTRELAETTHGLLQLAFGAEYREEDFSDEFDPVTASGAVLSAGGTSAEGDRTSRAGYVELSIPALSSVEVQVAGRYDNYSDFGDTFNPKLGVRWQPRESLLLRFSAGTGFKAPALHELYTGETFAFESVFDPVAGEVQEVNLIENGNPDLDAEESKSYNLGLVWDITSAWNFVIDYWRVKNENAVTKSPQFIVDNEDLFPDYVIRDEDGTLVTLVSPFQNVAEQKVWGIDLDTSYDWLWGGVGDFRLSLAGAYLGSFEQQAAPGADSEDLAGKDGRPEWRAQGSLLWSKASYKASLTAHYIDGYKRQEADDKVDSWTTVDAQFNWSPRSISGGTVTLGINNLLDEAPPEDPFLEGWPFFNRALHSPRGRFFYARYQHEF